MPILFCSVLSFRIHLLLDLRFSLNILPVTDICPKKLEIIYTFFIGFELKVADYGYFEQNFTLFLRYPIEILVFVASVL